MHKIVLATHNAGKIREFQQLFQGKDLEIFTAADFSLTEPDETAESFLGNAAIKAHYVAENTGFPAIADDSGLEIDALNGAPGVYSADWAETSQGRDFDLAFQKIQNLLKAHEPPYLANFTSAICIAWPDGKEKFYIGKVFGNLCFPPKGENGFGYDPIFIPDGYSETFAELPKSVKNTISHRAIAIEKLLNDYPNGQF